MKTGFLLPCCNRFMYTVTCTFKLPFSRPGHMPKKTGNSLIDQGW